ncbi:hypothetical protein [Deinococcus fonticola]|uniref:hypothetical protein n=1 Tax=Deinococcus fonticola TaxID=2528713 RepID=UPI001075823A|nr:hypothetical protein [Deinococcus fonticola]
MMEDCPPDQMPSLLAVAVYRNHLYTVSAFGILLPLYYYGPLRQLPPTEDVPFADQWAGYIQGYITSFYPTPRFAQAQLPHTINRDFHWQSRAGAGSRTWEQAVYRGWPLYIYGDGTQPDPDYEHFEANDDERHLFRRMPADIPFGPVKGEESPDLPTIPPASLGP